MLLKTYKELIGTTSLRCLAAKVFSHYKQVYIVKATTVWLSSCISNTIKNYITKEVYGTVDFSMDDYPNLKGINCAVIIINL